MIFRARARLNANWVRELQRQGNANLVMALAGNKADIAEKEPEKRKVDADEAQACGRKRAFLHGDIRQDAANVNVSMKLRGSCPGLSRPCGGGHAQRPEAVPAAKSRCC